jgi:peptide deformylase
VAARQLIYDEVMTVRPILVRGEPILASPAVPVTEFDHDLAQLVEDLFETNTAANGAGLAANQIGDPRSVFIYDCPDDTGQRHVGHVVNPVLETSEIPETMPHPDDDLEGCLSVPGEVFPTGRAAWARVTGVDRNGEPISVEGTGYFARCLQHESDHLAGHLYLERLIGRYAREARRMVKRNGWTVPGTSWLPGSVPDPFDH